MSNYSLEWKNGAGYWKDPWSLQNVSIEIIQREYERWMIESPLVIKGLRLKEGDKIINEWYPSSDGSWITYKLIDQIPPKTISNFTGKSTLEI